MSRNGADNLFADLNSFAKTATGVTPARRPTLNEMADVTAARADPPPATSVAAAEGWTGFTAAPPALPLKPAKHVVLEAEDLFATTTTVGADVALDQGDFIADITRATAAAKAAKGVLTENPFDMFDDATPASPAPASPEVATPSQPAVTPPAPDATNSNATPKEVYGRIRAILGNKISDQDKEREISEAVILSGVNDPALQVFAAMCKGILAATGDGASEADKAAAIAKVSEKFSFIDTDAARDADQTNRGIVTAMAGVMLDEGITGTMKTNIHEAAKGVLAPICQATQSQASPAVAAPAVAAAAATTSAPTAEATPAMPAADHDATKAGAAAAAKGVAALILALAAGPAGWALAAGFLYVTRKVGVTQNSRPEAPQEEIMSEETRKCVEAYEAQRSSAETTRSTESPSREGASPVTAVGVAAATVVKDETAIVRTAAQDLENTMTVLEGADSHRTTSQPQTSAAAVVYQTQAQSSGVEGAEVGTESLAAEEDQGAKKPSLRERFANWRHSRKAEEHQPLEEDDGIAEPATHATEKPAADKDKPEAEATPQSWRQRAGSALSRFGNLRAGEEAEGITCIIIVSAFIASPPFGLSMALIVAGAVAAKEIVQYGARAAGNALIGKGSSGQSSKQGSSPDGPALQAEVPEVSAALTPTPDGPALQAEVPEVSAALTPTPEVSAVEAARRQANQVAAALRVGGSIDASAEFDSRATAVAGVGGRDGVGGRE